VNSIRLPFPHGFGCSILPEHSSGFVGTRTKSSRRFSLSYLRQVVLEIRPVMTGDGDGLQGLSIRMDC